MDELVLTNAQIVLRDQIVGGSLQMRDGVISALDDGLSSAQGALDLDGDFLIPGLVELHTDNFERHLMPRPGTHWPVDAAFLNHDREIAAAGITTVYDAVCVGEVHPKSIRTEILEEVCGALPALMEQDALKADHRLHLRCEVSYGGLMGLLDPLIDLPSVGLVSVMDHTPGQRQYREVARYGEYYQGKFGLSDAQLDAFMAERIADQQAHGTANRRAIVEAARARGLPLASHDDATRDQVAEAIEDGVTIAEFPTTLEAAETSHQAGLAVLMGGPNVVNGRSHTGNLSARGLAASGLLDILSSDYVPASALHAALILESIGDGLSLPEAIAAITLTPARSVGLTDRGEICVGKRADLVRFKRTKGAPIIQEVWRAGAKIA
jgi:alpha-D-ribose 1-methylphosphonate 5-triphosphate diphosphatase